MSNKQAPRAPNPPSIPLDEGKRRLKIVKERAKGIISSGRVSDEACDTWSHAALDVIRQTFGSHTPHLSTFVGQVQIRMGDYHDSYERGNAREMERRIKVIDHLIGLIEMQEEFAPPNNVEPREFDFWSQLHPDVFQHAKARFDAGLFADSVEAAFKHINSKVKEIVLRKTATEMDGAPLMRNAFSVNNPIVCLDNLSTESGKNIQQGFMEIFAGSMTGIRNPKAHGNIEIDAKRAMHFLFLASLLLYKLDERL